MRGAWPLRKNKFREYEFTKRLGVEIRPVRGKGWTQKFKFNGEVKTDGEEIDGR